MNESRPKQSKQSRYSPRLKWVEERVKAFAEPGMKVLDIGFCGDYEQPTLHLNLKQHNRQVTIFGLDRDAASVLKHGIPGTLVGDGINAPFKADSFDMILCLEVVEHLESASEMFAEITRLLKPDGILLLTTPSNWALTRVLRFWLFGRLRAKIEPSAYRKYLGAPDHKLFYDPLSLTNLLRDYGLQVTELVTKNHALPLLGRWFKICRGLNLSFYPFSRMGNYTCLVARLTVRS